MPAPKSNNLDLLMLEKAESLNTNHWVYQLLRTNLLCGKVQPGLPLTIRGVAEDHGMSPMPVREAFHRLACEGAVEAIAALKQQNSFALQRAIEADIRDGIASINSVEGIHNYFEGVV